MNRLRLTAVALLAVLLHTTSQAETVVVYREGQRVDPHDVARVLGAPRTRGIRLLGDGADAPTRVAAAPAKTIATAATTTTTVGPATLQERRAAMADDLPAADALSLPVEFAFASADILPAARSQLDALAEGIKLLPPDAVVTVEGHTDATGPDAYNLALSRERALAVRDYLVQRHGIGAARLQPVAYGETWPLDAGRPYAPMNRRVQFRGG